MGAGCSASKVQEPKEPPHPAVSEPWPLKDEAIRVFKLGDADGNGYLDMEELKDMLKNKQFVETAMENMDVNMDGKVSLSEWLIAMKTTFDKSEAACKTAIKAHEKAVVAAKQKREDEAANSMMKEEEEPAS